MPRWRCALEAASKACFGVAGEELIGYNRNWRDSMVSAGKQLLVGFLSGLCMAAGAELGKYFVAQLVKPRPKGDQNFPGTPSSTLCPKCGRSMARYTNALFCPQCGHREG
jgi:hypothetical protein